MGRDTPTGLGFSEGYPFTIGREGRIKIDDPSLNRGHAEIRVADGKLKLRDLESTNGTFLIIDEKPVRISESFVTPNQKIALGRRLYTVKSLLAMAGIYVAYKEDVGLVIKPADPDEEAITVETDLDELVSNTISRLFANRATRALDRAIARVNSHKQGGAN